MNKNKKITKRGPGIPKNKKLILKTFVGLIILALLVVAVFFIVKNVKKSFSPENNKKPVNIEKSNPNEMGQVVDTYLLDETAPENSEVIVQGRFNDVEQKIDGKALFIESEGKKYLRLEEFRTINGQDLHVFLSPILNLDESDAIDLGFLRSVSGNFNYEIADDVSIEKYNNVLIWSTKFNAFFGYASLLSKELPEEPVDEITEENTEQNQNAVPVEESVNQNQPTETEEQLLQGENPENTIFQEENASGETTTEENDTTAPETENTEIQ